MSLQDMLRKMAHQNSMHTNIQQEEGQSVETLQRSNTESKDRYDKLKTRLDEMAETTAMVYHSGNYQFSPTNKLYT